MKRTNLSDGGFILSGVRGRWRGTCTATYSPLGKLLSAERVAEPFADSRPVPQRSPIWKMLAKLGYDR